MNPKVANDGAAFRLREPATRAHALSLSLSLWLAPLAAREQLDRGGRGRRRRTHKTLVEERPGDALERAGATKLASCCSNLRATQTAAGHRERLARIRPVAAGV